MAHMNGDGVWREREGLGQGGAVEEGGGGERSCGAAVVYVRTSRTRSGMGCYTNNALLYNRWALGVVCLDYRARSHGACFHEGGASDDIGMSLAHLPLSLCYW